MNWKIIFILSLFGLAMAVATVYFIPSNIEPIFWLVIFIISALLIAKHCSGKYFWHGFFVSLLNAVWITATHILIFHTYIQNHIQEAAIMEKMPLANHPRLTMLFTGPLVGILSGIILGLFAVIASKLGKKKAMA